MRLYRGQARHTLQARRLSLDSPLIALCAVQDTVSRRMKGEVSGGLSGIAGGRSQLCRSRSVVEGTRQASALRWRRTGCRPTTEFALRPSATLQPAQLACACLAVWLNRRRWAGTVLCCNHMR